MPGEYQLQWCLKVSQCFEFSVFLHKYDLKYDLFSMQVLKLDNENPIKCVKNIFVDLFIEENDPKLHIGEWQKFVNLYYMEWDNSGQLPEGGQLWMPFLPLPGCLCQLTVVRLLQETQHGQFAAGTTHCGCPDVELGWVRKPS